jgi:hypothetical protein
MIHWSYQQLGQLLTFTPTLGPHAVLKYVLLLAREGWCRHRRRNCQWGNIRSDCRWSRCRSSLDLELVQRLLE